MTSASYGSDLLWRTTYGSGEVVVTRLYDDLDRLTNITTVANGVTVNSFSYTLDATGRRTARQDADGARLDWGYDPFDQLTSAARTNSPNGAADAAYRYQYQYDLVGNRLREKRGPETDPLGRQLTLDGSHNNLNQHTARDWSGKLPLHGAVADPDTILLVQGVTNAPPYWNGTNWLAGATLGAGSNNVDLVSVLGTESNRTDLALFMPPAKPQPFQYDLNGNLLHDGYRAYTWDGENRLTAIEMAAEAVSDGLPAQRSEFVYDGQGRRLFRTDLLEWNGNAYTITNQTRSVWDGMAILAEIKTTVDGVSTNYNVWGLDLSQTLNGAGGVGGLLAIIKGGVGVPPAMALPCYDGNGNVTALLDDNGTVTARYEYTPFGQLFASSGPAAHDNPWRFSTKPYDDLWNLIFYEHRVYSPDLQIWLSRDPLWEESFLMCYKKQATHPIIKTDYRTSLFVYSFLENRATLTFDILGLDNPGCDLPGLINPGLKKYRNADCYLRCCAQHDECYYKNKCTAASWGHNLAGIAADIAGCKFCSIFVEIISPCARCNSAVVACFARCCTGINEPRGKRWFCPNGRDGRGEYFDDWDKIPASCWENGEKPKEQP